MEIFELSQLLTERAETGRPYLEFLRVPSLSTGLYVLPAGAVDHQQPHTEDEIYVVLSGAASVTVGDEESQVMEGTVLFVGASVPHRFHSIVADLVILVFFAPAEYTRDPQHSGPVA